MQELWNLYKHPSQPNFLAVLLKYLDARFIERESVVTSFMARSEKERQGRSVEDVKNEAEVRALRRSFVCVCVCVCMCVCVCVRVPPTVF